MGQCPTPLQLNIFVLSEGASEAMTCRTSSPCVSSAGMTFAYKEKDSSVDEQESKRVLDKALELGCTFLDTSDVYGCVCGAATRQAAV